MCRDGNMTSIQMIMPLPVQTNFVIVFDVFSRLSCGSPFAYCLPRHRFHDSLQFSFYKPLICRAYSNEITISNDGMFVWQLSKRLLLIYNKRLFGSAVIIRERVESRNGYKIVAVAAGGPHFTSRSCHYT